MRCICVRVQILCIRAHAGGAPTGLLHLLDEACRLPRSSDLELAKRFHETHGGSKRNLHFPAPDPRRRSEQFKVLHYAGEVRQPHPEPPPPPFPNSPLLAPPRPPHLASPSPPRLRLAAFRLTPSPQVTYTIDGFLDKNNGTLSSDLADLCASSAHTMLAHSFRERQALKAADARPALDKSSSRSRSPWRETAKEGTDLRRRRAATLGGAAAPLSLDVATDAQAPAHPTPLSPVRQNSPKANDSQGGAPMVPRLGFERLEKPSISSTPRRSSVSERALAFSPRVSGDELNVAPLTPRGSLTPRGATSRGGNRAFESIGLQFARQMHSMVAELNTTRCNFIRCANPTRTTPPPRGPLLVTSCAPLARGEGGVVYSPTAAPPQLRQAQRGDGAQRLRPGVHGGPAAPDGDAPVL